MSERERERQDQEAARESLRGWLQPGETVYTVLRHVSRSGMMRVIDLIVHRDGPVSISARVARAIGARWDPRGGVKVRGCGSDAGFALVYELSYALWPNGFTCTGSQCPSNDHFNGDGDFEPHEHAAGGFALRRVWL